MPGAGRTHGPPAKKMQAAGTTGSAETSRHSPRDGFHAYGALSPVSGLLATVIGGIIITRQFGASLGAPGPRVFTSASCRSSASPSARCSKLAATASPAPRLVTIAKRPSRGPGCRKTIMNSEKLKVIYFFRKDWTGQIGLRRPVSLLIDFHFTTATNCSTSSRIARCHALLPNRCRMVQSHFVQFPGPLTLHASRSRFLRLFGVSALFVAIGTGLLVHDGSNAKIWFSLLFFALCALVFATNLLPGSASLTLDADGFRVKQFYFVRKSRWESVTNIHAGYLLGAGYLPGLRTKVVRYIDTQWSGWRLARWETAKLGYNAALPDIYGMSADELAALMMQWRNRLLGPAPTE
ncbi:hypothetical protein ACQR1I_33845 [Bradyrhizobium sp. HKCCYLS2038]|uniref:hypothetical protein n=1 Tax=unclassified Bradyrhizobium TaxID=2631580 RepID=UPI003EBE4842